MKKYKFIVATALSLLLLSGCGDSEPVKKEAADNESVEQAGEPATEEKNELSVDKGLLNVEITIPAELLEDADKETVVADAKADGIKDVKVNEDGSITYKMSKSQHKEMLKEMKTEMATSITELETETASIQKIEYNSDFTKYKITVERVAFEDSFDGFTILGLGIMSGFYSAFNGTNDDNFKITFEMYDTATGEKYNTIVLPADLEEDDKSQQ